MSPIIYSLGGLLIGAIIAWLIASQRSRDNSGAILREELRLGREEASKSARELREEVSNQQKQSSDSLTATLEKLGRQQQEQLEQFGRQIKEISDSNRGSLDQIRNTLDSRVKELQQGNESKLEEMRKTVDEKLHSTLEKRIGESFSLVSERLEAVQRGLGEMQNLATGVGDLKRVLTNVKVRGTWAEVQLGALLEEFLAPSQFERNVQVKLDSLEKVEYAIRLPGSKGDSDGSVWLPIDSKFPQEDYIRIQEAAEKGDPEALQRATDSLARAISSAAQDISSKYVNPPQTTPFAIMFLATEGLYAEALRRPGFVHQLQTQWRILIAGPSTLAAVLDSLRLGFQSVAIEKRAIEVWRILGAVRTEFGKFGEVLDKVKRQLTTATNTLEQTGVRTRQMERKLTSVERLPETDSGKLLGLTGAPDAFDDVEADSEGEPEETI